MRIPLRPGVRLSLFARQNQDAVRIRMATYYNPLRVLRLISKRGWMVLLIRYDWRDKGRYEPFDRADLPLTAEESWEEMERMATDLYQAQDALTFVGEMCDILDRQGRQPTTAEVRRWTEGALCARQAGLVLPDTADGETP